MWFLVHVVGLTVRDGVELSTSTGEVGRLWSSRNILSGGTRCTLPLENIVLLGQVFEGRTSQVGRSSHTVVSGDTSGVGLSEDQTRDSSCLNIPAHTGGTRILGSQDLTVSDLSHLTSRRRHGVVQVVVGLTNRALHVGLEIGSS